MVAIERLLHDEAVPAAYRMTLSASRPAFVLGSVAADARPPVEDPRAATHFYRYDRPMDRPPWRVMFETHPELAPPHSADHQAFLAGYVAHLAMDEVWTLEMLGPHFGYAEWGESRHFRFLMLHALLIYMDMRDLDRMPSQLADQICRADPDHWLPFIPQDILVEWQTLIHNQIKPDGHPQTLEIFGERVDKTPAELQAIVADEDGMQRDLWQHVPKKTLAGIEHQMYVHARQSLTEYMSDFAKESR